MTGMASGPCGPALRLAVDGLRRTGGRTTPHHIDAIARRCVDGHARRPRRCLLNGEARIGAHPADTDRTPFTLPCLEPTDPIPRDLLAVTHWLPGQEAIDDCMGGLPLQAPRSAASDYRGRRHGRAGAEHIGSRSSDRVSGSFRFAGTRLLACAENRRQTSGTSHGLDCPHGGRPASSGSFR